MPDITPRGKPSFLGISSPRWACRLRLTLLDALPKVYGPRGMVMLGKAFMCLCFGFAYVGIFDLPQTPGLDMVQQIIPLPLWGVAWFLCAFMLIAGAFKVDQSRALGCVAALLCLWSLSYLAFFLRVPSLPNGAPNTAFLSAALLASMALSAAGVARMVNHAPSHPEVIQKPGGVDE